MADVVMPRLSDTMEEGTVSRWLKAEGDPVRRGDVLAEIETDKATMELEAYEEGVLQRLLVSEGATVPIGEPIAVIGEAAPEAPPTAVPAAEPAAPEAPAGTPAVEAAAPAPAEPAAPAPAAPPAPEAPPAAVPAEPAAAAPPPAEPAAPAPAAPPASEAPPTAARAGRPPTSPLARKIARERGVDLATVTGTGPDGRIVRADVEAAARRRAAEEKRAPEEVRAPAPVPAAEEVRPTAAPPAAAPPAAPPAAAPPVAAPPTAATVAAPVEDEEVPLTPVRRITAQRLTDSATTTPHFHLTSVVDAGALLAFRHQVNEHLAATGTRVTVTDLLIRACAVTLRAHPQVNSSWAGDRIVRHHRVHIGVAVALDDGLIVPVVRDADRKSLGEIATEAHDLAARARSGKLTPDEFRGGTFTISNLGMYGIDQFTAVINPPEAAILAVGAATEQPVLVRDGLTTRTTMALTLGIDHRVLDGATAARFLGDLKGILEQPLRIVT